MWRGILLGIFGLIVLGGLLFAVFAAGRMSALHRMGYPRSWRVHHKEAASIMADLGRVTTIDDPEYLRPSTRLRVDTWLAREKELINRGIGS